MAEWRVTTVGELCELRAGSAFPPDEQGIAAGDLPFIKVADFNLPGNEFRIARANNYVSAETAARLGFVTAEAGATVFAKIGAAIHAERYRLLASRTAFDNNIMSATAADGVVAPAFLRYLLESLQLGRTAVGSALPYLTQRNIMALPCRIPDVQGQQAIAEVLGAIDDKIAADLRLESAADSFIHALYSIAVAERASEAPLMEALQVRFGEPFAGQFFCEPGEGRPLIRIRDLKTFRAQVWTTEQRSRETVVAPGDVVVGMDAEFTPTAWLGAEGVMNQRVCMVKSPLAGPAFVREALKRPLAEIEGYKSATTVIHLNKADLERHVVLVPSDDNLRTFEAQAEPAYWHRIAVAQERAALTATRDGLLPALMSGALPVKSAERLAEDLT